MERSPMPQISENELDRRYIRGYRRKPENPALGRAGAKLTAEVWPEEEWRQTKVRRGEAAPPRIRKRKPRPTL
jgi:hypothetical protein